MLHKFQEKTWNSSETTLSHAWTSEALWKDLGV